MKYIKTIGLHLLFIVLLPLYLVIEANDEKQAKQHEYIGEFFCLESFAVQYLKYREGDFIVKDDKGKRQVNNHDLCKEMRGLPEEKLCNLLKHGYVVISKAGDDYKLTFRPRLQGGGLAIANGFYWGMQSLCWGIVAGATTWGIRRAARKARRMSSKDKEKAMAAITIVAHTAEKIVEKATEYSPVVSYVSEMIQTSRSGKEVAKGVIAGTTIAVGEGGLLALGRLKRAIDYLSLGAYWVGMMIPGP